MIGRALGREFAIAFVLAAFAGALMVVVLQVLRLLPLLAAARPSVSESALALGLSLPLALDACAPVAFAVAAVLVALRWDSDGELAGARCAGLSPLRLWSGPWRAAAACAIVVAVVSNVLGPWSVRRLETFWQSLVPRALVGSIRPTAMVELAPGLRVFADHGSRSGLHNVVVEAGGVVLAARRATIAAPGGAIVVLRAQDGVIQWRSAAVQMRFERLTLPLDVGRAVRQRAADLPGQGDRSFAEQRNQSSPVSFIVVAMLVSALAIELVRRPGWLVAACAAVVGGREVLVRVGESARLLVGVTVGAWLPVIVLVPLSALLLLLVARRAAS